MKLAYFINQFPMPSMTFIRRELHTLESEGYVIQRYALQPWLHELPDAMDNAEKRQTRYIKPRGFIFIALTVLLTALCRPRKFCRAALLCFRVSRTSDRSVLYHVAYFAEACVLRKWLLEDHIDHLHVHFGTNAAEIAMLAHVLGGPTYSVTIHGSEEFERAPCLSHGEKIERSRFVAAVSSFGRSQLMRWSAPADWHKIHVVRCTVDAAFLDSESQPLQDSPRVVCVGRLCEQKGQLLLIQAVRELVNSGVDIKLRLVGDGPMRSACEHEIARLELEDYVHIQGWATGEQVRQEILNARAVVLTSFAENLPVVLMEALALERPVISTRIAGIPELVLPGTNGWLVTAGSVAEITQALNELLTTPVERLREMGRAGRKFVRMQHNAETEPRRLLTLLQSAARSEDMPHSIVDQGHMPSAASPETLPAAVTVSV